ncbi:hypothetical protein EKD16_24195 [Streptomonospora litoralis]|uniref:Uncharacterized protein n=1 Tax=Streptomonospora litoralis TaxID=2498135 RepID=A0A4P6QAS1_9ACTN|nr:hypothetical protein EKD16_24195 [Streptomonospora litoralis]
MSPALWRCRLCTRPNLAALCGYCGYPFSEQWRLPPLPGRTMRRRRWGAGAGAPRVRPYVGVGVGVPCAHPAAVR